MPERWLFVWALALGVLTCGRLSGQHDDPAATYTLDFDATWSRVTHPRAFPSGARFSALAGAVHDASQSIFAIGDFASPGLERLAETASRSVLTDEVRSAIRAGRARQFISAGAIPQAPGSVSTSFTATLEHPLVTVVAAIGPSPDWFVGVSALNLRAAGDWARELQVILLPLDAGTDSGADFNSPDRDTNPAERIRVLDAGPFAAGVPLGTFTLRRQDPPPVPRFIRGDADQDERLTIADAVAVLLHLFAGHAAPRCLDAADSTDGGRLTIASAVAILNHLFLGGPPPPPPFPACGRDPTALDPLGCEEPACP